MSWIPVTERMPKASDEHNHDDDVLLYIPPHDTSIVEGGVPIHCEGGIFMGHPLATQHPGDEDGKNNFWGIPVESYDWIVWNWSYFMGAPHPTHWMPLPDKPEAVKR